LVPGLGALVLFLGLRKLAVLVGLVYGSVIDITIYRGYGEAITSGSVPYRDFAVEYPPGALPLFVGPALVTNSPEWYRRVFEGAVLVILLALLLGVKWLASHGGTADAMPRTPLLVVSVLTAVMGAVALTRFDVLPAALTVGTLVALASSRWRLGGVGLGAAIAVKLYPIVLLPLVVVYVARLTGRRMAVAVSGIALGVVVIAYAPFLYLSVEGVRYSVEVALEVIASRKPRGSLLAAFHTAFGFQFPHQASYYDFPFHSGRAVARASTGIGLIVLGGLWIGFARTRADTPCLIRFSAATLAAFIGFGKVFSPQYLLWIIPLVALVPRKRGLYAIGELGLASLLTALVFPRHFTELTLLASQPLAAIIVRDLLILALVATLAWPTRDASHLSSKRGLLPRVLGRFIERVA
jgi:hypothetical protein